VMQFCLSNLLFLLGIVNFTCAQNALDNKSYSWELSLTVDNDILFFEDYYYTAGHQLAFRRLVQPDRFIHQYLNKKQLVSSKVLISYKYGNKIFTPRKTHTRNMREMDRPYAGWNYVGFSISRLKGSSTISHFESEIGVVGQMSGMGQMQQWMHQQVGYPKPQGWDTQIRNEVVLNTNYQLLKSVKIIPEIDVIFHSGLFAGTGLNMISQNFTIRLLNMNSLTESAWFNARLGYDEEEDKQEVFIFINGGIDYVLSNIFLEGSLFDNPSPFTVNAQRWVFKRSFGIMHSRNRSSFLFEINNSTPEFEAGQRHGYARLAYAIRF